MELEHSGNKSRLLGPDEAALLFEVGVVSDTQPRITVVSHDSDLLHAAEALQFDDRRPVLTICEHPCDALVACVVTPPHLLILDTTVPGFPSDEMIACLRRHDMLRGIPVLRYHPFPGADRDDMECGADDLASGSFEAMVRRILAVEFPLADHAPDGPALRRRWPRIAVRLSAAVDVAQNDHGADHGEAIVENISWTGALITRLTLDQGITPGAEDRVRLSVDDGPLNGWQATSEVTRVMSPDTVAVRFIDMTRDDHLRIAELFVDDSSTDE